MTFAIAELAAPKGGRLGICPLPGRFGAALDDMAVLRAWRPDIVVSMTELAEMERHNMADMGGLLAQHGVAWAHFPVRDFGTPAFGAAWDGLSARLHDVLDGGGRVLAHCYGGQGRTRDAGRYGACSLAQHTPGRCGNRCAIPVGKLHFIK